MRVVFRYSVWVWDEDKRRNNTVIKEIEESDPEKVKQLLAQRDLVIDHVIDDGQGPYYHTVNRTRDDDITDEFYNQLLEMGKQGYRLLHVSRKQIVLIRE